MCQMTRRIEISSKTIIFTIVTLLALRIVWEIRELIYALFLAFIFMSALNPLVVKLEKLRIPRAGAAFIVVISTIVLLFFVLAFMIPPIVNETIIFITNLPVFINDTFPFMNGTLSSDAALQFLPNITTNAFKLASGLLSNIVFVVSVLFFTFYFLLEEQFFESFLKRFLDDTSAKRVEKVMRKAQIRMGAWMRGELILMTVIGLMTYIALTILNVPFALSLAFFAGLLEIVPIIGPIVAAIPALIVASSSSLLLGGATAVVYVVIQQLENNLVVPYVMNKAVGIHPITTLVALSIGGKLGGIVGAILAVPIALVIETVFADITKNLK